MVPCSERLWCDYDLHGFDSVQSYDWIHRSSWYSFYGCVFCSAFAAENCRSVLSSVWSLPQSDVMCLQVRKLNCSQQSFFTQAVLRWYWLIHLRKHGLANFKRGTQRGVFSLANQRKSRHQDWIWRKSFRFETFYSLDLTFILWSSLIAQISLYDL